MNACISMVITDIKLSFRDVNGGFYGHKLHKTKSRT